MKLNLLALLVLFASQMAFGQLSVQRNFNLELVEKDPVKSSIIEKSLNGFLNEALAQNYTSEYVDTVHLKKYDFFFRKLSGIGNDSESFKFNKPSVLKSYSADGHDYRLTLAFTGLRDSIPFVFQITELKAVPYLDHYRFYCPFEENTKDFKEKAMETVTYHYSGDLNEARAGEFTTFKSEFASMTQTPNSILDYYCFQDLDQLLKAYGFLYSARQCNFLCYDLGFSDNEGKTYLTGTSNENFISNYIEDYVYYNLPNEEDIYWPFLTGMSMYYGGYGIQMFSVETLKGELRDELVRNPDFDFLEAFKKGRKSSVKRHFSHYVISAILCEELIEKGGFDKAMKLVYSGEAGELFFKNLEETLNITELNFHKAIAKLILDS